MSSLSRSPIRLSGWGALALASVLLLSSGCAGDYVARTRGVRSAYQQGDYSRALESLEAAAKDGPQQDRLLVLMDKGMVLHAAGQWAESNAVLEEAERLSEQLDSVSVSEEAKTLVTNERQRAYKGEDFEKLMISVLQALNYVELGDDEAAMVEVRQVNDRLEKMIAEEKKPYEQLAIARYLGGVIREDQRDWDSAYIDYAKAYEIAPRKEALAEPLLRLAKKVGRDDMYAELLAKYPDVPHEPLAPGEGQLIVVVEAGLSPEKQRGSRDGGDGGALIEVPVYRTRGLAPPVNVALEGQSQQAVTVTSLADVAVVHLDDRIGRLLAKQLAGVAVKAGVAAGVGALTKSGELGALTFLVLNAVNAPDLRSWLSLPAEFQVARFRVSAGSHTVRVTSWGQTTEHPVEVKPGRIGVLVVRRY
ncbi:COG3014 family protein [Myxococcus sp. Y35]|uniref:COG3014 family protein n=1 Tax=Pseudomyxococcus flavus TaxID=3115648 RepID=UPI003CEC53A3